VTGRRRAAAATALAVATLVLGLGACSSGSDDSTKSSSSSRAGSTRSTKPAGPLEQWVARWRGVVATEYGPAQQEFLAAVQGGEVAKVQAAATTLLTANEKLLAAVRGAGPPPAGGEAPAGRLQVALTREQQLLEEIQRVCTGPDTGKCQPAVTGYGDNNSKQIVPALVALKI
jgi:hypothetical protein